MTTQEARSGAIYLTGLQNNAAFKQYFLLPLMSYKEGVERTLRSVDSSLDEVRAAQGALSVFAYIEGLMAFRGEHTLKNLMKKQSGGKRE